MTAIRRSAFVTTFIVLVVAVGSVFPAAASTTPQDDATLTQYARDTWASFVAMTDATTGLTADNISETRTPSAYTSPTNIGAYMWSTLTARDLGFITAAEAIERLELTIATLETMERSVGGMYYNWYNPATGAKLTTWPVDGNTVYPFLSSVDNGWLAAGLMMVSAAVPTLAIRAGALVEGMNFGCYYDPQVGQIRGGFWDTSPPPPSDQLPRGNYCQDGADVYYTGHHYGTFNTEPRIASYIGIAAGDIPPEHYFKTFRTFPDTCDWGWPEMKPDGAMRTYMGVNVYEGHYTYRGMNIVPTWGGSMFEALMVPLLVPEELWGPHSWGINHPLYVRAQIEHGMDEAAYGYWGFSPSNDPAGGYREYGVDAIGMNPDGYTSNEEHTKVDYGFGECRPATDDPPASAYTNGVVTPHASFIALPYAQVAAEANLANLRSDFDAYGWGGFFDAINVSTGQVSKYYLALDQGMIMAALGNSLLDDRMRSYFAPQIEAQIRPLMAMEHFTASETCSTAWSSPYACSPNAFNPGAYLPLVMR